MESRLLRSHRAVGSIADDCAATTSFYTLGGEGFMVARVCGDAFHIMKLEDLTVQLTSPRLGRHIDALVGFGEWTFVAMGPELWAFERVKERGLVGEVATGLKLLCAVGETIVGVRGGPKGSGLVVWGNRPSRKALPVLLCDLDLGLDACAVAHPPTYVNKVVVGSEDGELDLWNVRSQKRIHQFECLGDRGRVGVVAPSGVVDVLALARGDGCVEVVHARRDELLFCLMQKVEATCLVFVSGGARDGTKRALLVAGGKDGWLRVWDLEERRLAHEEVGAHGGREVLAGLAGGVGGSQPTAASVICTTVGGDNAVAQWTFEAPDGACRAARRRQGHAAPPTLLRWYGPPACGGALSSSDPYASLQLLTSSTGDRTVRVSHAARDVLNGELSQGSRLSKRAKSLRLSVDELRLPPVVALAACDAKDGSWANVVTCHLGQAVARCWHLDRRCLGPVALTQPQWDARPSSLSAASRDDAARRATACAMSPCGHFAVVGHADGRARKYNVQSGRPRGEYPSNLETAVLQARRAASVAAMGSVSRAEREINRKLHKGEAVDDSNLLKGRRVAGAEGVLEHRRGRARATRHRATVTGLYVDGQNAFVATASLDGTIKWWDFSKHGLKATTEVGAPVARLEGARPANLVAAACDDGVVRVFEARPPLRVRLVRRLDCADHRPPRDLAWTPDFKFLFAVRGDGTLRVWDVASAALVDWLDFPGAEATGVSVSPTGEFVATAHVGERGIALWTQKNAYARVELKPLADDDGPIDVRESLMRDDATPALPVELRDEGEILAPHVQDAESTRRAIRLSGKPRARIDGLYALEAIASRNKPIEAPKKPEAAPFFLPGTLDAPQQPAPSEQEPPTKRRRKADLGTANRCKLASLALESEQPEALLEYLGSLEPAAVDAEIALLCRGDHDDAGLGLLGAVVDHLAHLLLTCANFDDVQAYVHRLIQHHSAALATPGLKVPVRALHKAQREAAARIRGLLNEALCLVDFLSVPVGDELVA